MARTSSGRPGRSRSPPDTYSSGKIGAVTSPPEKQPIHPRTFGEQLRRTRETAGATLDEIIAETKISRRVLEALEEGKFGFLPERVFSRNFVMQYARVVGADPDRLAESFERAWERYLLASGSHPSLVVEELPPATTVRWGFWIPIILGAVVVLAVAAMIVAGWTSPPEELPPDPRRSTASRPSPTAELAGQPSPRAGTDATPTAVVAGHTVEVAFEVEEGRECWVYYRDRDGWTDQRLLAGGERLELSLAGPVTLTVGNAEAVTVVTGGRRYEDLGGPGEVVHARVDRDGLRRLRGGGADGG